MKINSNFKDVYDSMVMYGVDETQVLNRIQSRIDIPVEPGRYSRDRCTKLASVLPEVSVQVFDYLMKTTPYVSSTLQFGYLFFCGQVIPCLMKVGYMDYFRYQDEALQATMIPPEDVFYVQATPEDTLDALMAWAERCGVSDALKQPVRGYWPSSRGNPKSVGEQVVQYLHQFQGFEHEQVRSILTAFDAVYMLLHICNHPKLILYPSLKDLKLLKHMDIMTIYQEIMMYHSSTMVREDQPPVILADEYRQAAHGFDHKYAFRKRKQS
jgi:hypothetical protein